jgi:phenylacetate-CoA ligase
MPAGNCTEQFETFHFAEDAFLLEVIDPDTGEDLTGTGRVGEYVVTSLLMEGTPLLRFRMEDVGYSVTEPCKCGRTGMRLGLSERLAHALRIGKHYIYSKDVEEVLYSFPEFLLKPYHLVKKKEEPQEKLILRVERPDRPEMESRLKDALILKIKETLGVESQVEFISKEDQKFVAGYKFLRVVTE